MKRIKIYGIQRTGTNFVQQLCRQNLKNVAVFDNPFGWKHGPPLDLEGARAWMRTKPNRQKFSKILDDIGNGNLLYPCIIIKNPYSWHQSIKKWSGSKFNLKKSYKRYNKLYRSYKLFHTGGYKTNGLCHRGVIIRYEDALKNPRKIVSELSDSFGINFKGSFTVPNRVPQSGNFSRDRKKFYLSGGTFGLPEKLIKRINDLVDWELMKFYGYKPSK